MMIKLFPNIPIFTRRPQPKRGIAAGIIVSAILLVAVTIRLFMVNSEVNKKVLEQKSLDQLPVAIEEDQTQSSLIPSGYSLPFKKEPSSVYGWRIDPFNFQTKRH